MQLYPPLFTNLVNEFSKLPGIGKKSAERLAIHILKKPVGNAFKLADSIVKFKEKIRFCSSCFALSEDDLCPVCADESRQDNHICVVENLGDMFAIEKSNVFDGVYHILQGSLSPMDGIGPDDIRIKELMVRVQKKDAAEIIIATGTSLEGENTAAYLINKLKLFPNIKISRIASGVPVGGDLKYLDHFTVKRAMEERKVLIK